MKNKKEIEVGDFVRFDKFPHTLRVSEVKGEKVTAEYNPELGVTLKFRDTKKNFESLEEEEAEN